MKKIVFILLFLPLICFGAIKLPYVKNGIYLVKQVNLDSQEFFSENVMDMSLTANEACLVDSKPESLTITPDLEKLQDVKFGSFKLGNNEKFTWFIMGKDPAGYYSQFYIDLNLDENITANEKVPGFETYDNVFEGLTLNIASVQRNAIPLMVSYKGSTGEIKKKLFFYLWTGIFKKKNETDIKVWLRTVSVLEGLIGVIDGKENRLVRFRLFDSNNNCCYNDYSKDVIIMDLNYDNIFSKKEAQPLNEFFDTKLDNQRKQLRFIVLPYPGRVQMIDVLQELDFEKLEPESDKF